MSRFRAWPIAGSAARLWQRPARTTSLHRGPSAEPGVDLGLQRRELEVVNRKLRGLIEAIAEGPHAPGLQAKLDELEQRKTAPEAELAAALPPAPRLHPNPAEIYRRKVADLQAALADPQMQAEALEILRGLIERSAEKGFEIELVGEIVAMVDLGAYDKTAGPSRLFLRRICVR